MHAKINVHHDINQYDVCVLVAIVNVWHIDRGISQHVVLSFTQSCSIYIYICNKH